MKRILIFFILLACTACVPDSSASPLTSDFTTPATDDFSELPDSVAPEIIRASRAQETLRLAMREPVTLNPLLNEDITVDHMLKLIFEPLVILDENLKPTGHLADYNFSSDYSTTTLTLRRDAIWSDSAPVTADDIIFSIDLLRTAPDNNHYKHCVKNIAYCEKLDTKSVKITYHEVNSASAYLLQFPIIPQHYYKNEKNPSSQKNMQPLGSGLFVFDHLHPLDSITLKKNPYTFRPAAQIENVEAIFIPDYDTEFYAFQQGLLDVMAMEISEWSKRQSVKEALHEEYPAMYFDFIGFNFEHPWLKHKNFRQALAFAYDADEAIRRVYLNHVARSLSPINPASWLYAHSLPDYEYNPNKALDLIRLARAEQPAVFLEALSPFRILVNEENDERKKIAQSFAAALREIGLEAEVETCSFDEFSQRLETGDYDIFVGCFYLDAIPDLRFAFHSDGNIFNYRDPELDGLLEAAASAPSESEHIRRMSDVQHYIAEDLPVISLAFRYGAVLTDVRVQGELQPALWNPFAGVNHWVLE